MSATRTRRRTLTGVLTAFALSMIAMTGITSTTEASEAAMPETTDVTASAHGCPSGAVCVYPSDSWNGGNPTYVFWSYGSHKIYNQYGTHRIFNNQYGDAFASACRGGNGNDCRAAIRPGSYSDTYLTPINSIRLFH